MPDNTQSQTLLARLHTALDEIELAKSPLGDVLSTIAAQAAPDMVFEALCDLTEECARRRNALDTQLLDVLAAIREIEDEIARND